MSKKRVYFGTKEKMSWVKAPSINMVRGVEKFGSSGTYTNGGGYVLGSAGSHENYDLTWSLTDSEDIDLVQMYYSGIYGSGLIYWSDPFVSHRNALPLGWSAPGLGAADAPTLFVGRKPTLVKTAANSIGLPVDTAVYVGSIGMQHREIWVPVPEGHSVAIGVVGSATGNGAVQYKKDNGAWTSLPFLTTSATTTVNTFLEGLGGGVSLRVQITTGTISLTALTVKVYKVDGISGGVATNLATNPSFEATSGTVEVWRNNIKVPKGSAIAWSSGGWGTAATLTNETVGGPIENGSWVKGTFTAPSTASVGFWTAGTGTSGTPVIAGQTYELGFHTYSDKPYRTNASIYSYNAAGALVGAIDQSTFPYQTEDAGEWNERKAMFTFPSGVAFILLNPQFQNLSGSNAGYWETGDVIGAGAAWVTNGPAGYSDGSYSPDPDLTPYWEGPVNNAPSVLTGRSITGVSQIGGRVILQSSQWSATGAQSLRILRTQSADQAAAGAVLWTSTSADIGETYTAIVKCYIPEGYDPSGDTVSWDRLNRGLYLFTGGPVQDGWVQAPSEPGVYDLRVIFKPTDASQTLRVGGGGAIGQSIYWDVLAIVEGIYTGGYFDGSMQSTDTTIFFWNGPVNASTSTMRRLGNNSGANKFILGGGTSGMKFVPNTFNRVGYSAVVGKGLESAGVQLKEVGSWLN